MVLNPGGQRAKSLEQRFWEKIEPDSDTGCWVWTGARSDLGYGRFSAHGKQSQAHRVVYEYYVGFVPAELYMDHLCRNPACVNPAHLQPVTPSVNVQRGLLPEINKARYRAQTHCKRDHLYDEANTAIRPNGTRACKKCMADLGARRYADPKFREHMRTYSKEYQRKRREQKLSELA